MRATGRTRHRLYFDCSLEFRRTAVAYVLHTWIYECFHAVPYLRFLGISGAGKTRGTETIGALCYHPLMTAGAASPAVMFRQIEVLGGTMLMDEADFRESGVGSDIAKVLTCGYQQGLPFSRLEKQGETYIPRTYDVFGPKIITGRSAFRDDAVEDRCLAYTPYKTKRKDIPVQLPLRSTMRFAKYTTRHLLGGWTPWTRSFAKTCRSKASAGGRSRS